MGRRVYWMAPMLSIVRLNGVRSAYAAFSFARNAMLAGGMPWIAACVMIIPTAAQCLFMWKCIRH
ncbi:MAG: hypothetical protein WC732_08755 [Candidatus Omnitrophota bacterium]